MLPWRCGLGLLAGAVFPLVLAAQVDTTRPPRDTTRRDTAQVVMPAKPNADTLLRDTLARRGTVLPPAAPGDTVKAPIARAELPRSVMLGPVYSWTRDEMFTTGALTVQDLLDRIPGVTGFRSGWIATPMATAYLGRPGAVRAFLDGVELDVLDSRDPYGLDLSQVALWMLDEIRIERGATEIRIHMRSWRVDRTTPFTRVDVTTGDQETNLYRGFYGKRFNQGADLQFAAQQYGTTPFRGGSSDQFSAFARTGVARGNWSVDVTALRTGRHRGVTIQYPASDSISGVESSRQDAYLRAAWGDPDGGVWAQGLAVAQMYKFTGRKSLPDSIPRDTSVSQQQYIAAVGITRGPMRASATGRLRNRDGRSLITPVARASWETGLFAVSGLFEGRGSDSVARTEVAARATVWHFGVSAAAGTADDARFGRPTTRSSFARADAGLRFGRLWITGGVMRRDSAIAAPPRQFDTAYVVTRVPASLGYTAAIRGNLWKDAYADIVGTYWPDSGLLYLPRYQTRAEVGIRTRWLSRFPSGNLGIATYVVHEYRSGVVFPTLGGATEAGGYRVLSAALEIRILSGVAFYQFRDVLGDLYYQVPGYLAPRQTQLYGLRWEFWN